MRRSATLARSQLEQAYTLLEREQRDYLPKPWQLYLYFALVLVTIVLVASWVVVSLHETGIREVSGRVLGAADGGLQVGLVVAVVLIGLNVPLLLSLWRHEKLRRRLGLEGDAVMYLADPRHRVALTVTAVMVGLALLFMIGIGALIVVSSGKFLTLIPVTITVVTLVMGPWIQSGRSRLRAVQELRETLQKEAGHPRGEVVEVPAETVRRVAELEQAQIARERQEVLSRSRAERDGAPLAVQQSRAVINSKSELDPKTRIRVEDGIVALAAAVPPVAEGEDPATGLAVWRIAETGLELGYQVDYEARRLRVYYITGSSSGRGR